MIATIVIPLLLASSAALAEPLTFSDVCPGYNVVIGIQEIRVMCPNRPLPFLTLKGCGNASVEQVRPRRLWVDLTAPEDADIAGWVEYYRANPSASPQYRIVLSDRSLARRAQITEQYTSDGNLRINCTFN